MSDSVLRAILDSLDHLPDSIDPRTLFREGDGDLAGKYVFGPDGFEVDGYGIANGQKLQSALGKERNDLKAVRSDLAKARKELAAAQARAAELETQIASGNPDAAASEKALRSRLEAEMKGRLDAAQKDAEERIGSLSKERDSFREQLQQTMVDSLINSGTTETYKYSARLLAPHLRSRVKVDVDPENGQLVRQFLSADGQPGYRNNGQYGLDDILGELSRDPEFGALISKVSGQPGSTSAAPPRGAPPRGGKQRHISVEEMNDFPTYQRIAAEAERDGITLVPPTQNSPRA